MRRQNREILPDAGNLTGLELRLVGAAHAAQGQFAAPRGPYIILRAADVDGSIRLHPEIIFDLRGARGSVLHGRGGSWAS